MMSSRNKNENPSAFQVRSLLVVYDDEFEQAWQGNSQGATNCDDCLFDPDILFEGIFPVEYSCDEMIGEDWQVANTTVELDYEAVIPLSDDVSISENIRELEWSLLNAAVKTIGLDECDFEQQYDDDRRRRLASLAYPTTIYAINSNPEDTIDSGKPLVLLATAPVVRARSC
jgi:hypothetical protein